MPKLFWLLIAGCLLLGRAYGVESVAFAGVDGDAVFKSAVLPLGEGRLAAVGVVGANPAAVRSANGKPRLEGFDSVTRVAILKTEEPAGGVPKLGSALDLTAGDPVFLERGGKQASRIVKWENSYRGKVLPVALIRVHHPGEETPIPGTPLYNANGEVVAVCHQAAPEFGNGTFALPVEVIKRVLKDVNTFGRVAGCWIGVTVNAANPVLSVEMVRPDSPGSLAGIEKGDILLSVGPHAVSNYAEARNAFYYLVADEPTFLTVLRGTEPLKLKVVPKVHPAILLRE